MTKNGYKVLDSDMHLIEPPDLWQRYMEPAFKDRAPIGLTSNAVIDLRTMFPDQDPAAPRIRGPRTGHNFERNQRIYEDHARRGWTSEVQLEAMDVEGIDVAVLFPSRGLSILTRPHAQMDPPLAAAVARAYNNWLFDFCQADPSRLVGSGMISVYNIDDAVAEARRVVRDLGFRAVFARANIVNGKAWHDPYYEPLWDALEELGIPIGFHEATGSRSRQIGDQYEPNFGLRRFYSQPFEQMTAVGSFVAAGVLERHPQLKVAFLEANCSWVPWLLWRMDEGYELEGDAYMTDLKMLPSEYFKRQCWVSVEPDEAHVGYVIEQFGNDQLVFSTDYPHTDSRYPEAVESFLQLPLSDEDKRKILWDNCARFYSISDPVQAGEGQKVQAARA